MGHGYQHCKGKTSDFRRNAHHSPHSLLGVGWGGVEWSGVGCKRSLGHVPSTMLKMLMLRSHGVGWGGVGGC